MRAVPPNEEVLRSYNRYFLENEKYRSKLLHRLAQMTKLYEHARVEVEVANVIDTNTGNPVTVRRRHDSHEARRLQVSMADIDSSLIACEEKLLAIKTQLGIIEPVPPSGGDEQQSLFKTSNIKEVWRRRKEREKEIDVTNSL